MKQHQTLFSKIRQRIARLIAPELASLADKANLAYEDHKTKTANARAFDVRLNELIKIGRPFAAVVIDINNFKKVNDKIGHVYADQVLLQFVDRLSENIRLDDGIFVGSSLFRTGGDEFVVLMPLDKRSSSGLSDEERLELIIHRLRINILDDHEYIYGDNKKIMISATGEGSVLCPSDISDKSEALNKLYVRVLETKKNNS